MEIEIYQRNDVIIYATLRKSDGTPYNLSSSNFNYIFEVENDKGTVEIIKTESNGGINVSNDVGGVIRIMLDRNDTDIPKGEYNYELVILDNDTGIRETFVSNTMIVNKSIID